MTKTYERGDEKITRLVAAVMADHHPRLCDKGVTVDVLMIAEVDPDSGEVFPALKLQGYPCAATIKVTPLADRALGRADALLTIDHATWQSRNTAEKRAILDHECAHLDFVVDEDGAVRHDDLKRPKLKLRLHDWQLGGFIEVAQRHGSSAIEVQEVRKCRTEAGQWFWDFGEDTASEDDGDAERAAATTGKRARRIERAAE